MPLENRPKGRFLFVDTLIFRDDRYRTAHVELVAEADLHLVLVDVTVPVKEFAPGQQPKIVFPDAAPIRIAVLGKDRPIVGDCIVDAAADRPAHPGARNAAIGEERKAPIQKSSVCDRHVGVEPAEGDASGAVDEGAIPGDTRRPRIDP